MAQPTESGCLVDTDFRPLRGHDQLLTASIAQKMRNIIDSNDIMLTRNSFSSRHPEMSSGARIDSAPLIKVHMVHTSIG
jgi:hypothetical protein